MGFAYLSQPPLCKRCTILLCRALIAQANPLALENILVIEETAAGQKPRKNQSTCAEAHQSTWQSSAPHFQIRLAT